MSDDTWNICSVCGDVHDRKAKQTDAERLAERLRTVATAQTIYDHRTDLMHEAAAELTRLSAEVAALRKALAPFAKAAAMIPPSADGDEVIDYCQIGLERGRYFTVAEFRRALAATAGDGVK